MIKAAKPHTYGGISSDAVLKATGKSWPQWLKLIDAAGGRKLTHPQIAALLADHFAVRPWWSQMVTVGYEQARGMRQKHEMPQGFQISRSKTIAAPLSAVFAACHDAKMRAGWLGDEALTVRKATKNKSIRTLWSDGKTTVEFMFYAKPGRAQVVVQHNKLPSASAAERMKAFWGKALDRLDKLLTGKAGRTKQSPKR